MIDKVELVPDLFQGVFGATARVELADGRKFESVQGCIEDFPVEEKLQIGAKGILSKRQIARATKAVDHLEDFDDVRDFIAILCPHAKHARRRRRVSRRRRSRRNPRFTG